MFSKFQFQDMSLLNKYYGTNQTTRSMATWAIDRNTGLDATGSPCINAGERRDVLGLLFHAVEHTMRHTGQLMVTVKILNDK